ncbi:MAG TPA: LUD domain-containing protein [Verrucomicrobiae bacterium]|nr:LUD domain-containing protein [Verrucomicrobiae bacterium]
MARDYARPVSDTELNTAKAALEKNGFKVEVVDDLAAAKQTVLAQIPQGADVYTGTSVTLDEAGLTKELEESGHYDSARKRFMPLILDGNRLDGRRVGSASDYAVGSVHAITQDGQVLVASSTGSQLPNYVYGANHVIWVVGTQKIVKDLNEAIDRIETHALPLEDVRAQAVYGVGSAINRLLIYRKEPRERVTIILIKQAVGY